MRAMQLTGSLFLHWLAVPSDEWNVQTGYEEKVSIEKFFGDTSRDLALALLAEAPPYSK